MNQRLCKANFEFYVYELVDPRNGEVFYVGKGRGDRIHAHERDAKNGEHSTKCERIRSIWKDRRKVVSWIDRKILREKALLKAQYSKPKLIKCIANWLRAFNGEQRDFTGRPFAAALWKVAAERDPEPLIKRCVEAIGFDDFKTALQRHNVHIVRG